MTTRNQQEQPINLFIDTNILLGFYRFTQDDIEQLSKLEDIIVKTKKINLYVTEQQVDEFYRNRDTVIKSSIDTMKVEKPILPKTFSEHSDYAAAVREARDLVSKIAKIKQDILKQAQKENFKADAIVKNLFKSPIETTQEIFDRAKRRMDIGNPPGKKGSLGDAINWEILLDSVTSTEMITEVHIISDDVDYRSALDEYKINPFLNKEWNTKKLLGEVHLYRSLNSFFSQHFPDIALVDEAIKDGLIEQLRTAGSFDTARALIKQLQKLGNISEGQAKELFKSATTNDQVYNAHIYSPTIIGDALWDLIAPHWKSFSDEEQEVWISNFPDETMRNIQDES